MMREKETGGKACEAVFRDKKKYGWKAHYETIKIGKRKKEYSSRIYAKLFSKGMARPSCYQCVYANKNRVADITLADFWGHEKAIPGLWDDDKGISLVLINNRHGMVLWDMAKEAMDYVDCTGYPFRHTNMKRPTKKPEAYDSFWQDYRQRGFAYCAKKYAGYEMNVHLGWKNTLKRLLKMK